MALVYFEVAMPFLRKKPINQYIFADGSHVNVCIRNKVFVVVKFTYIR